MRTSDWVRLAITPDLRAMPAQWYVGVRLRVPARKPGQIRKVPTR